MPPMIAAYFDITLMPLPLSIVITLMMSTLRHYAKT